MALNRIIVPNDVSILYTALYFIAVVAMHNRGSFLFILRASYLPSIFDRCDKSILIVVIKRFIQLCFIISILLSWEMLFNTTYLNLLNLAKNIIDPILSDYLFIYYLVYRSYTERVYESLLGNKVSIQCYIVYTVSICPRKYFIFMHNAVSKQTKYGGAK